MEKVYIFGHRNPDTDSVAGAISLSYLKNKLGMNTIAAVLSGINRETRFALDYFHVKEPKFLNDVKIKIKDLEYTRNYSIPEDASLLDAYKIMEKKEISKIPVVNSKKQIVGIINMKDIARDCLQGNYNYIDASYDKILDTIKGKEILKFEENIKGNVIAPGMRSTTFLNEIDLIEEDILVLGNRPSIIEYALKCKIKLIIITNTEKLDKKIIKLAKENKVNIITTKERTLETIKILNFCNKVSTIMNTKGVLCVHDYDDLSDFIELANKTRYSYYPVLDKNEKYVGIVRFNDIDFNKKKKVILVDHNSYEQSAIGLDEAEIIEIVDHHNISLAGTKHPINFRNMIVGSSCTIIYLMFKENNIEIPKDIAGLMLSGILSDTLILTSPTTTGIDKEVVNSLSKLLDLNYKKYGTEMLKAGTSLKGKTIEEVLYTDFKSYTAGNEKIGLGQILTTNIDEIEKVKDKYIEVLNQEATNSGLKFIAFYVTDFIQNGSYVYYSDEAYDVLKRIYGDNLEQGKYLPDIISRKKQILPEILREMENE